MALADIFGGQIDFNSDLQPGRSLRSAVREVDPRRAVRRLRRTSSARRSWPTARQHQAFRWVHPETGKAAYYDEEGRSLKRFFLVSPLKFEPRVTSSFSRRRLHPVLNTCARTPASTTAPRTAPRWSRSPSGTVVSAGWAGGGGNQVRIRHDGGVETYYLHLSSFGAGRSRRRARRSGADHRPGRLDRHRDRAAPALSVSQERRVRRSGRRAPPAASRRADPATHLADFRRRARRHAAPDWRHSPCRAPVSGADAVKAAQ